MHAGTSGERWRAILLRLGFMPPALRDQAIEALVSMDPTEIVPEDRTDIWTALRSVIHRHRRLADAKWELPAEVDKRLYTAYQRFEPDDIGTRYSWLFTWQPELPDSPGRDWRAIDDAAQQARGEAVDSIHATGGVPALLEVAAAVELPHQLGTVIGDSEIADIVENELLSSAMGTEESHLRSLGLGFVQARFKRRGWNWAEALLSSETVMEWSDRQKADLACGLPFDARTWRLLQAHGPETKELYWKVVSVSGAPDDQWEEAVRMLLEYGRPYAAMDVVALGLDEYADTRLIPAQLVAEVLEQVVTADPEAEESAWVLSSLDYHIESSLRLLEVSNDIDESRVARLEWAYLSVLAYSSRHSPRILHRELAENPSFFAEVVTTVYRAENDQREDADLVAEEEATRATQAHLLLRSWQQIPGLTKNGDIDLERLRLWVRDARERCHAAGRGAVGDHEIGQVFSWAPSAPDGVWPAVPVREVIEDVASRELERGIHIGVYNRRGVYTKAIGEGGKQERALAERYRTHAGAVTDKWPRTAAVLRSIATAYERDARDQDIRAELIES